MNRRSAINRKLDSRMIYGQIDSVHSTNGSVQCIVNIPNSIPSIIGGFKMHVLTTTGQIFIDDMGYFEAIGKYRTEVPKTLALLMRNTGSLTGKALFRKVGYNFFAPIICLRINWHVSLRECYSYTNRETESTESMSQETKNIRTVCLPKTRFQIL